jgi:hypothetical protein
MIGIYDEVFYIASKHDFDAQFFFCSPQYLTKVSIINIKMAVTDSVIFIRN